jgi:LmbE family N-acetylglucosaminyl deacetylase
MAVLPPVLAGPHRIGGEWVVVRWPPRMLPARPRWRLEPAELTKEDTMHTHPAAATRRRIRVTDARSACDGGPVPAGGPLLFGDGLPPGGRCRLLGVFAHPDDETFCAGGTFARYAEQGAEIMVVSATRGQAGQIRDPAAANRQTIAAVREAELRLACERLGITAVRCLDHVDGTLAGTEFWDLVGEVAEIICEFRPDVVITFGPDGGYGHPDHVTISAVTTAACQRAAGPGDRPDSAVPRPLPGPPRLYYRCFPPGDLLITERLVAWLTSQPGRCGGTPAFAHAFLLLAEAAGTLGHIRDHIQVRWYPPGSYVVEQDEVAAELFLILSGEAEVRSESDGDRCGRPGRLGVGEFFGYRHPSANVVATSSLTCLALSPAPPAKFAGRGRGARLAGAPPSAQASASPAAANARAGQGVIYSDVSGQVMRKVGALSAYRSQFPLEPGMFPEFLLREMFGCEYFVASPAGRPAHRELVPPGPVPEPELSAPPPAHSQAGCVATRGTRTPSMMTRRPARRPATRHPKAKRDTHGARGGEPR